ncbi:MULTISPECIES: Hsp20/alpha crystallin family protein [Haloarcula]|uniref:Hsp20/alpha crystallin family protein n=1 Tax=Haloarcula TaxID=2237 RepID=UPI0023E8D6D8|nr:Hsp20/alpha crystallin family protein [Halomicroarcula sp. SHR3]
MSALREALGSLPDAVFADVLESEEGYLLVLDLPGVTADSLEVTVEAGRLVIEGQRSKDVPREFRFVREDRSVFLDVELPLPPDATGQGAEGTVERGVLELTIPKASAAPSTTIPIDEA